MAEARTVSSSAIAARDLDLDNDLSPTSDLEGRLHRSCTVNALSHGENCLHVSHDNTARVGSHYFPPFFLLLLFFTSKVIIK